ncbi:MAG TPA: hypothetical protein VGS19_12110 [Streptosporangiaceae bacterium]|nr:hypothetical protein [Streptosporangiaceae bacterium]
MAAYAKLLLPPQDSEVVVAMLQLCHATVGIYDAVLYTADHFDPKQLADRLRAKVADQQRAVDTVLHELANEIGLTFIEIPQGLTTAQRVGWSSARLRDIGVLPALA